MSENNRYREEEKDLEQDEEIVDSTEEVLQEEQKTVASTLIECLEKSKALA